MEVADAYTRHSFDAQVSERCVAKLQLQLQLQLLLQFKTESNFKLDLRE